MEQEGQEPAERQERGDAFDDLFDDLDRFFAPDPEQARRRRAAGEEGGAGPADQSAEPEPPLVEGSNEVAPPEDLLPSDWRRGIESLDVGEEPPEDHQPEAEEPVEVPEEPSVEPPSTTGASVSEPTAEMTGDEWTRLRDVLGEEKDEGEALAYEAESPEVSTDESMFGYEDEDEANRPDWLEPGGGHELTLEDMKKAPPEYRHLPGPQDESGRPLVSSSGGQGFEARQVVPDAEDDLATEEPAGEELGEALGVEEPAGQTAEEPEWPEPTITEVEAAADQLAEDFRDAEAPSEVEADLLADLDEPSGPRTVRVGAPESMTGPTWEEPTSQPLMAETGPPASGPGRDIPKAVITAGLLAIAALLSLWFSKAAFVLVAGGAVLLGQTELYATMRRKGHQPATALGLVVGGFMMAGAYRKGEAAIAFFVVLGLFLSFLWYMAAPLKARENLIHNVGGTLLGVLYGPALASYVFLLLAQPASGRALMLTVIGLTFWYDTWAFLIGSVYGRRPLAPTISPRKSWEGLVAATAITIFSAIAIVPTAVNYLSVTKAIGLAIVVIVFAPLGDLIESLIKRDLGVKDMGSLLPGHGGVLDRIDSVLLVAPAAFYYIRLIF
jgi:phosphatidate cytidylyltransferase